MSHKVAAAAFGGLVLLGPSRVAFAQETAAAAEVTAEPATALVERGIAMRRAGQDAAALALFQQAEQLDPNSVRIQVHLAATHQALGEWEAADRHLSTALQDPMDPYIQRHEATLAAARRTIDGHIGSLLLLGGPPGTQVRLNGRVLGKLPLEKSLRVEAGIYRLEATLLGHYPVTRTVALAGGEVTRESIQLTSLSTQDRPEDAQASAGGPTWLTWTFGGLALAGGVFTGLAWAKRENHAETWNDDSQCLAPGQTREELCGDELDAGKQAEVAMWIGAGSTIAFAAASVATVWLNGDDAEAPQATLSCGVGLAQIACRGSF